MPLMATFARTQRILRCDGVFDETLVMAASTTAVDTGVGIDRSVAALVAEKLFDDFKGSRLRIEQNFGA